MAATREICKCCGEINRVGFDVPDYVWRTSVPEHWKNEVLCLNCFTRFGDEAQNNWAMGMMFYPVPAVVIMVKELLAKEEPTNGE